MWRLDEGMWGHEHSECRSTGTGEQQSEEFNRSQNDPRLFLSQGLDNTLEWEKLPASITRDQGLPNQCGWGRGPDLSQPPNMAGSYRPSQAPHPPHMTQNRTVSPDAPPPVVSGAATLALNSPL